jgi:hemerythrin-like domain-containing protein
MARGPMDQPGLRVRMGAERRRISSQHRQLDAIYGRVEAAIAKGAFPEAREALGRFRDAWEAHTSLEDGFYFPALRGLRPAVGAQLEALSAEHARSMQQLAELEALVEQQDRAALEAALERFVAHLADHEGREERLLAELTGGTAG